MKLFFELIQVSLGQRDGLSRCLSESEWEELYAICQQQAVAGVVFPALEELSRQGQRPPQDLLFDWLGLTELVKAQNVLMNREAARLTRIFEDAGHRTAILKGQANARLYPHPLSRQPGDIDIWVDGGRTKVIDMLMRTGLLKEAPVFSNVGNPNKATDSYHHVHLPVNEQGVTVEVHFRPSSGNYNPITNRRLQKWLEREIENITPIAVLQTTPAEDCSIKTQSPDSGGEVPTFNVPSTAFALVMQLAHIQRHFMSSGIGMRQILDYYFLLKTGNDNQFRMENEELRDFLRSLGLGKMAGAMMWVLGEVMHLDERLMICKPDARRGEWLLHDMLAGGNFGHYANASDGLWRRFFKARLRQLKMIRFNFWEGIWAEVFFWKDFVKRIPLRMKYRTLSLNRVNQKQADSLS